VVGWPAKSTATLCGESRCPLPGAAGRPAHDLARRAARRRPQSRPALRRRPRPSGHGRPLASRRPSWSVDIGQ
jgi:hypothetical protein